MKNSPTITAKSSSEFTVAGVIDFDNVTALLQEALDIMNKATHDIRFDFAEISHSNSAGLALLTALLRHANETKKNILFLNLPAKLLAAAKISDLDAILPCTPPTSKI